MLLQVVTFSRDVGDDGPARTQFDFGDFPHCRVWFLWFDGVDLATDSLLLVTALEGGSLDLASDWLAGTSCHLVESRLDSPRSRERGCVGLKEGGK